MTQRIFKTDNAKITIYLDAPAWDGERAVALGAFSCKTAADGQEVLAEALAFIRTQGLRQVVGPMDGDTWHSYRFVTESDGSPAFMLEPSNKDHEAEVFTKAGFSVISRYFSARVPLSDVAADAPDPSENFTIETWDGHDPERLFEQVFDLSVAAFADNAFYKPITREAFLAMYMPIVPMIKKELIYFARRPDGTLAGFLFGIPNYAEGPQTKTAILKTYASLAKGAGRHLAYAFHQAARATGHDTAIHALIHDDNLSALRSAAEGAEVFRRYSLLGLKLDG